MTDKRGAMLGDVYESQDDRDTDPTQPNGLRRVKVLDFIIDMKQPERTTAQVQNVTSGRRTSVRLNALLSSKWKLIT